MKKVFTIILLSIVCCIASEGQALWFTENSGTTQDLNRVRAYSSYLYAVGKSGTLIRTSNNGLNWMPVNTTYSFNYNDIVVTATSYFLFCDNGNILRSTNQGINWSIINSGINYSINSVSYYAIRIYAACNNGVILRSTNNGANWTVLNAASADLNSALQTGPKIYAAGNNGVIIKSTDYGLNWATLQTGTTNNINSIWAQDSIMLYACGSNGTLIKSMNAGLSWNSVNTGYSYNFTSITGNQNYWSQTYDLYLTSTEGKILKSTNSGTNWTIDYNGIEPLNYLDLYASRAAGNNGLLLFLYQNYFWKDFKLIDANSISTYITNYCSFNRNIYSGNSGFEWPKGSAKTARFASGMWLGGIVDNDTLIAMAEYDYEFFPGYTDNTGTPQGKLDTLYRVYKIEGDINSYDRTKWPNALLGNSDQGAPVYYDNQTNSWKPLDFGAQTLFTSFTDSYPESHQNNSGSTAPLKADIKLVSYDFIYPGALYNTVIQKYAIINKSNKVWNNFYITFWTDDDVGDATDDMVACDTNLNLAYTYNGDNNDGVYGTAPPAVAFLLLKGPTVYTGNNNDTSWICNADSRINKSGYKDRKMDAFNWYCGGCNPFGDPRTYYETYNQMKGLIRDGNPIINPITNQPTTFIYSGDPVTGQGWVSGPMSPGDQRFLMSTGPINMNPGDTQYIVVAQIIARGTSNLNSITVLRQYAQEVRNYYKNCFSGVPIGVNPVSNQIPERFELYQNYPNPFNPRTSFRLQVPSLRFVRLVIYNSLGQEVSTLINDKLNPGTYEIEWDGSNFASGIYYYSLIVGDKLIDTRKMVLLK